MIRIRLANAADAKALLDIYGPHILHSACTFETETPSEEQFAKRIDACLVKFPWIVCEADGVIAGYVYASTHRDREAYQWTCECSVYTRDGFGGKGIGRALYRLLFDILTIQGFRNVYAGITRPNAASEALHRKLGFECFAVYEKIGYKLGTWHNVGWWRLRLNEHQPEPPPPVYFSKLDPKAYQPHMEAAALEVLKGFD